MAEAEAARSDSSDSDDTFADEEGWEDAESDHEELRVHSLFDAEVFSDITSMLEHTKNKYGFDFLAESRGLDDLSLIRFINYLRARAKETGDSVSIDISAGAFDDDKYLAPVIPDDALLLAIDEITALQGGSLPVNQDDQSISSLSYQVQLEQLKEQFAAYRTTVERTLEGRWTDSSGTDSSSGLEEHTGPKRLGAGDQEYFGGYAGRGMVSI